MKLGYKILKLKELGLRTDRWDKEQTELCIAMTTGPNASEKTKATWEKIAKVKEETKNIFIDLYIRR